MHRNKLNIIALGLGLIIVATPNLIFAKTDFTEEIVPCTLVAPVGDGSWTTAALKQNFDCLDARTTLLLSWVRELIRRAEQPTSGPGEGTVPPRLIEGIPTLPVVTGYGQTITQEGWKGPEVNVIQDFLKAEGSFTYPQITGYFGPITRDAVKTFQTKYGLPSTGVVDKPTLEKMQSSNLPQVTPNTKSQINNLVPTSR